MTIAATESERIGSMELIDRSVLRNDINRIIRRIEGDFGFNDSWCNSLNEALYIINEQKTVDAEPIKHGEWIYCEYSGGRYIGTCSLCGCERKTDKYCPNCGAKMD